jgi:hypothetical protein
MKEGENMTEYLDKFRSITEELEAIVSPMQEEDYPPKHSSPLL